MSNDSVTKFAHMKRLDGHIHGYTYSRFGRETLLKGMITEYIIIHLVSKYIM